MKEWNIWTEGYAATGESGTAHHEGAYKAETFDEAVEAYLKDKEATSWPDIRKWYDKKERYAARDASGKMPLITVHTIWACRLFDNEADARKSFG